MAMFLKSGEDDDMDFGSGSGSKLASLFGFNQESSDKNQSLTYTAPKQPRKDSGRREAAEKSQASSAMACLHAVPVTAYKFEKGQYVNQGKVGAAIVGSQEISNYKMILYKGKQQQIVAVMISTQFKFTVQPNNYANIYDDQRQNWSILFDTKDAVVAFAKHVALAMANSVGKNELKSTVIQDLVVGEGFSLGKGDMAEIKYTGWLMNQNTFGQVFDKNVNAEKPFRLKLGKGKVIKGWEEGVVGMKTDGLRLLIVPPSLAYGSQGMGNRVPPDSTLIFEVEVIKMKTNKDKSDSPRSATSGLSDSESSSDVKPVKPPKPRSPSVNSVGNVRKRAESVTEQLASSPKSNKANIISRMAKMGQPMLPLHGAIPAQLSDDSDADEVEATKAESLPVEVPASEVPTANKSVASNESSTKQSSESSTSKSHSNSSFKPRVVATEAVDGSSVPLQVNPHQQLSLLQTNPYIQHASMMSSAAFPSPGFQQQHVLPQYLPMQSVPSSSSGADSHLSILLSETRTQNTELRFNLSKISDKVDTVINKIDNMKVGYSPSSSLVPSSGMSLLEPSMLLHSIEKMVQENTSLRKELDEKRNKLESQTERISELLNRNQRFIEQSSDMFEQKNNSLQSSALESQNRIMTLEREKSLINTHLNDALSKIDNLKQKLSVKDDEESTLRLRLGDDTTEFRKNVEKVQLLSDQLQESQQSVICTQKMLEEERRTKYENLEKLSTLEGTSTDLKLQIKNLEQELNDEKLKSSKEPKKSEQEIEDLKSRHQDEVKDLKRKLLQQSAGSTSNEQLETELNSQWQKKCDKLLSDAELKHKQESRELIEEKDKVLSKLKQENLKLQDDAKNVISLQNEIHELSVWKTKYEKLYSNVLQMKQQYEERIEEVQASSSSSGSNSNVKKIMNSVYKQLQSLIDADASYSGHQALELILNVIRNTTIQFLEQCNDAATVNEDEIDDKESERGVDEVDERQEANIVEGDEDSSEDEFYEPYQNYDSDDSKLNPLQRELSDVRTNIEPTSNISDNISDETNSVSESDGKNDTHVSLPSNTSENLSSVIDRSSDIERVENNITSSSVCKNDGNLSAEGSSEHDVDNQELVDDSVKSVRSESKQETEEKLQDLKAKSTEENPKKRDDTVEIYKPQPPPPPLWLDDDSEDDWFN